MHNAVNRWLTVVILSTFVAIIAYGARGAARARPGNSPTQNVNIVGSSATVPVSVQGTANVTVSNLPAVQDVNVTNLPAVQVSSLPAVQLGAGSSVSVSSVPAISLAPGQSVGVSSLPAVQLAPGQSLGTYSYGDNHPFLMSGSIARMTDGQTNADSGVLFTVPAGSLLVIDSLDVDASSENGGNYAAMITLYSLSSSIHLVPKQLEGFNNAAAGSQVAHLVLSPGAELHVSAVRADGRQSGEAISIVTISGHFVPAP